MQSVWNSCETCVKSLNDGAERLWVEPVRRNCHTKNRSGRRSNSFDKLNDDFVERRSGAAVGRTRSTKLSNDEAQRPWVEVVRQDCRATNSLGFRGVATAFYESAIRREYTLSYVFADKSNQHHLTHSEGMHHSPFESFLSSGIALHFADPHISLSVGILS